MTDHQDALRAIERHYSELAQAHGNSPKSAQWADVETQEKRMAILAQIGDVRTAKILDFGCGTGHLLTYLERDHGFAGEYCGLDLSTEVLEIARRTHGGARFERRDVLKDPLTEQFDYVFISGTFNNKIADNWALMTSLLRALFPAVRKGLAFNALSTYVDFKQPDLSYIDPDRAFRFCKEELSPAVTLRHDYQLRSHVLPYEYSIYVLNVGQAVRKNLGA